MRARSASHAAAATVTSPLVDSAWIWNGASSLGTSPRVRTSPVSLCASIVYRAAGTTARTSPVCERSSSRSAEHSDVVETLPIPPVRTRTDFYFKFLPAPDGKGFDSEPALVYCHRQETSRSVEGVDGEVILRDSRFDPVADLPVRRLVEMTISERRSIQRGEIVSHVPAEWLLPYVHQRYDDLSPTGDD